MVNGNQSFNKTDNKFNKQIKLHSKNMKTHQFPSNTKKPISTCKKKKHAIRTLAKKSSGLVKLWTS